MPKQYKWKADTTYKSDTSLSYGVIPTSHTGWQPTSPGTQSGSWTYWFRDANYGPGGVYTDANSSRVAISLSESWDATIDGRNNLTISITTTINSVVRDDLRGNNPATPGRTINIYRSQGGSPILSLTDSNISTAHTIWAGPATLDRYTFTLAPGESLQRSSLYLHNQTIGYTSYDDIWFGVLFMNDLPKDYRPGASLNTNNNVWVSHNRENGACHIITNASSGSILECRTVGGDEGEKGNPPLILTAANANSWRNQKLLGKQ